MLCFEGALPLAVLLRALYGNQSKQPLDESGLHETELRGLHLLREHLSGVILDSAPIALKAGFGKASGELVRFFESFHPPNLSLHDRLMFGLTLSRVILGSHLSQLRAAIKLGYEETNKCLNVKLRATRTLLYSNDLLIHVRL